MKRIGPLLFLLIIMILSCGSGPQTSDAADSAKPTETAPPVQSAQPVETPPPSPPEPVAPVQTVQAPVPVEEKVFDPASITEEKFTATKTDVQSLIGELNGIIRARNYNAWTGFLSASYFDEISSADFLEERTEELYKRDQIVASNLGRNPRQVQKKILRTPKDYFDNVVVPSRQNDRMDDIEFVSENRVIAYTVDTRGNRLILYDLEYIDGKWKIIS